MPETGARRVFITMAAVAVVCFLAAGCSRHSGTGLTTTDPNVTVERSIIYRTVDGESLNLDACLPTSGTARQPVVLVHGGAFHEGDRSNLLDLCRQLADAGFAAFPVDYRLIPKSYPAQIEDVQAAVAWLREPAQLQHFDIDGKAIALLGSSAGGIVALSTAEALAAQGDPAASVVTLSAAGDLTASALTLGSPSPDLQKVVLAYLGCDDIHDCADAVAASPITNVAALPPTLLIAGTDELIPSAQTQALTEGLQDAGVVHQVVEVPGSSHGLRLLSGDVLTQIESFLRDNSSS